MGADFVEPDLVCTADGVLVCRHDVDLSDTTDGDGLFAWDLTLAELSQLRARERLPELRSTEWDGAFAVPTFAEVLELAARAGVGVYPETKHPEEHRARGLALEPLLAEALRGWHGPAFLQSFSARSLRELRGLGGFPLVQLMGAPLDLAEVATYADAVGPAKALVDAAFVERAHALGLQVHPYTFRRENAFLPADLRSSDDPAAVGDWRAEYERYFAMGVDGVFTDNPDLARQSLSVR